MHDVIVLNLVHRAGFAALLVVPLFVPLFVVKCTYVCIRVLLQHTVGTVQWHVLHLSMLWRENQLRTTGHVTASDGSQVYVHHHHHVTH
jgi:hypothetical protein